MSHYLDEAARRDPQRAADLERSDAELARSMFQLEKPTTGPRELFLVSIGGTRENPRLSFSVMAHSSMDAFDHAVVCKDDEGERVEVRPAKGRNPQWEYFPITVARHAVACVELHETATQYAQRKARENDRHALDLQVQFQGCIGGLPR